MSIESIYTKLTPAIIIAEDLEATGWDARAEFAIISMLEEQAAALLPASTLQGAIARRGAVRAALKAGDEARAGALCQAYLAETDIAAADQEALRQLMREGRGRPAKAGPRRSRQPAGRRAGSAP